MKGMQLFDNYEEDGQLSLFSADYDDWDEDWEETPEEADVETEEEQAKQPDALETVADGKVPGGKSGKAQKPVQEKAKVSSGNSGSAPEQKSVAIGAAVDTYEKAVAGLEMTNAGPTVRVKYCASCGKLLFVREETAGFHSECNNCGIKYFQKL